jgi:RNA polymerase sigma-70 factor (sigma-E family)
MVAKQSIMSTGMEVAAQSDPRGLAALYERHAPDAVRLAYLLTGDRTLAQVLVQEAFARLVGRLAHLRTREGFDGYLRRTIVNLSRDHFRRRKLERSYLARQASLRAPSTTVEPDVAGHEAMRAALMALPARQRAAIVLRFYEDMTDRQVSEVLGCRPGTVRSLISRGVQSLRADRAIREGDAE